MQNRSAGFNSIVKCFVLEKIPARESDPLELTIELYLRRPAQRFLIVLLRRDSYVVPAKDYATGKVNPSEESMWVIEQQLLDSRLDFPTAAEALTHCLAISEQRFNIWLPKAHEMLS